VIASGLTLRCYSVAHIFYLTRYCPSAKGGADQWCAFTSTNIGASPKSGYAGRQKAGPGVSVSAGKDLHITCSYNDGINQNIKSDS
jgi:hypothetical protein